ncbi:MAG: hypothetical protein ONB15_07490 [candidate division KSB1 bacterium]|nr:hypothetical protein [candidate division KSB1 bacterium]
MTRSEKVDSLRRALKSERNFYERSKLVEELGQTRDPSLVQDLVASLDGGTGYGFQKILLVSAVTDPLVRIGPICAHDLVPLLLSRNSFVQQAVRDALMKMKWKPAHPVEEACLVIAEKGIHSGEHVSTAIAEVAFALFGERRLRKRLNNLAPLLAVVRDESVVEDVRTLASAALSRLREYVTIEVSQDSER